MRVLIIGGAGFKNSGDEALLLSTVQIIRRVAPWAKLTVAANNEFVARQTLWGVDQINIVPSPRIAFFRNDSHYFRANHIFLQRRTALRQCLVGASPTEAIKTILNSSELDFIDRENSARFLSALADCDTIVVHGGGILTSPTRSRLIEHALTVEVAVNWGKRVLLRSHQIGPLTSSDDRDQMRSILSASSYVSTRDLNQSSYLCREVSPDTQVFDAPDDALLCSVGGASSEVLSRHGVARGQYICVGFRDNPSVGVTEDAYFKTAEIVLNAHRMIGGDIVLLPQGPFDIEPLKKLTSYLDCKAQVIEPNDPFRDPVHIAENARLMIACPHHSLIFALRNAVPVISPVMGDYYLFKNKGSMRFFELERFVIDLSNSQEEISTASSQLLHEIFDDEKAFRSKLSRQVEQVKVIAQHGIEEFRRCLLRHDDYSELQQSLM